MKQLSLSLCIIYCLCIPASLFGQSDSFTITDFGANLSEYWKSENTGLKRNEVKKGLWFIESKEQVVPKMNDMSHLKLFYTPVNLFSSDAKEKMVDVEMAVTLKPINVAEDANYGLRLYFDVRRNVYFSINSKNEFDIIFAEPTTYIKKSEKCESIKANESNTLKIKKRGAQFEFSINDKVVCTYTHNLNPAVSSGCVFISQKASLQVTALYLNKKPGEIISATDVVYKKNNNVTDFSLTMPSWYHNTEDKGYMAYRVTNGEWFIENQLVAPLRETDMDYLRSFSFPESIVLENGQNIELGVILKQLKVSENAKFGLSINTKDSEVFFLINNKQQFDVIRRDLQKPNTYLKREEKSDAIKPNGVNSLTIKKIGSNWEFLINDKSVFSFTGIYAEVISENVEIQDLASLQVMSRYLDKNPDIIISIPDKNFKAALIAAGVDKNNDGEIQKTAEAALVTKFEFYERNISSLEGIQYFENLTSLNCAINNITELDLTKNTKLTIVYCIRNKIKSLDLSKNPKLETLGCSGNALTSLDVSANKFLKSIECADNQLASLDLSNNKNLTWVDCKRNKLTSLNVTGCFALTTLQCENNLLKQVTTSQEQTNKEEWTKDAATEWAASTFTDCNSFNIISDPGHLDCLTKFENTNFSYQYHPLWKTPKTGEYSISFDLADDDITYDNIFPLGKLYHYNNFTHTIKFTVRTSLQSFVDEVKGKHPNPKEFDFTTSSGQKGKIITFNYVHEMLGINYYEMYVIIQTSATADTYFSSFTKFMCNPNDNFLSGVKPEDEAAFRQWASAYANTLVAK